MALSPSIAETKYITSKIVKQRLLLIIRILLITEAIEEIVPYGKRSRGVEDFYFFFMKVL